MIGKMIPPKEEIINMPFGKVLTFRARENHVVLLYFLSQAASLYDVLLVYLDDDFLKY